MSATVAAATASGATSAPPDPKLVPLAEIPPSTTEETSYSNFHEMRSIHLDIKLTIDFDEHLFRGSVTHTVRAGKDGANQLVLDAGKGMKILRVLLLPTTPTSGDEKEGSEAKDTHGSELTTVELKYTLTPPAKDVAWKGNALTISLPPDEALTRGQERKIRIEYETGPGDQCSAVQWLAPEATLGKKHPFMFTQCQAIHCRSMIPCQDAPCVKVCAIFLLDGSCILYYFFSLSFSFSSSSFL